MATHRYWRVNATANVSGVLSAILELNMFDAAFSQNKAVTGGTAAADSTTVGYTAAQAFDGDTTDESGTNKAWASASSALPHWLSYDFVTPIEIKAIGIIGRSSQGGNNGEQTPTAFDVQFSDNNSSWTTSWSESGLTQKVGRFTRSIKSGTSIPAGSPHGSHAYWRLAIIDTQGRNAASLGEIEMRATPGGADQCTGGTASAKNIFSGGFPASNAFDNSSTTLWSGTDPSNWIQYHFASAVEVAEVTIKSRHDSNPETSPEALVVMWSDNGTDWTMAWGANSMLTWSLSQTRTLTDPYYSTPSAPDITSITPNHGTVAGGTAVTIAGHFFTGSTNVQFDGTNATSIVVVSDISITCVTPAGPGGGGSVDVEVFNPLGNTTAPAIYSYDVPTILSLSPITGSDIGGDPVTITGTMLTGTTDVKFDTDSATSIVVVNSTTITCVTPAHFHGLVDVSIFNPLGDDTLPSSFTFLESIARITQIPVLIVHLPPQPIRITQLPLLFAHLPIQSTRVTQIPLFPVTTQKPIPLPLPVVPETPVKEIWQWKTVVNIFEGGKEQRSALRSQPRVSQQFSAFITDDQDYLDVYSLMLKFISRTFNYPMYHYWSQLDEAAVVGDTKLYFNPAYTDLRDGESIAFFDSLMTKTYLAVIDTVDADGATLAEPLTFDVPAWYFVSPAPRFKVDKPTMSMGSVAGDFQLKLEGAQTRDILRPDQVNAPTIIDGMLLLDIRPLADDNNDNEFDQNMVWLDNGIADPIPRTSWYAPFIAGDRQFLIHRPAGIDVWRAIAANLCGMQNPFLLPTFRNDLPVVGTPALSATQFLTSSIQFFEIWRSKAWKYIRIQSDAGIIYRKINEVLINYSVVTGEPESLTVKISGNIGAGAGSNSNMVVSFVNTCRLNSDEIVIDHGSVDSVLSLKVRMVEE